VVDAATWNSRGGRVQAVRLFTQSRDEKKDERTRSILKNLPSWGLDTRKIEYVGCRGLGSLEE
jgi:hypothetical protein